MCSQYDDMTGYEPPSCPGPPECPHEEEPVKAKPFFFTNFCGGHCGNNGRRKPDRHCPACHAIKREKAAFAASSPNPQPTGAPMTV
jgi:hypothetical protein